MVCEPFTQWVLEDAFSDGRPPFEDVGVQLVADVEPYELMKLRLLNASHQALCYLGYLAGYRYAHEVCQDPLFAAFLLGYMDREATPTLAPVPGVDLDAYKHQLIERFANPEVRDTLARLCAESSDRIPKWLVPVVREQPRRRRRRRAAPPLVVASWARYAEGVDEQGEPIEVVDRLRGHAGGAGAPPERGPAGLRPRPRPVRRPRRRRAVRQRRTAGRWTPCTARAPARPSRSLQTGTGRMSTPVDGAGPPCAWRSCDPPVTSGVEQRPAPSPGRGEVLVRVGVGGCLRLRHPLLRPRPDRPVRGRVPARARARGLRRHRRGGRGRGPRARGPARLHRARRPRPHLPDVPQRPLQPLPRHARSSPHRPIDGAFAELVVVHEAFAHPVPDSISDDAAALLEPLSVGGLGLPQGPGDRGVPRPGHRRGRRSGW